MIENFELSAGKNWETAAMKNLLNHYGLASPQNGEPFSEAMCLGLSGGIGVGYSFCPSIPKHAAKAKGKSLDRTSPKSFNESLYQCGSGSSFVGRPSTYSTSGEAYRNLFDRLGIKTDVHESTGIKGAEKKVCEAIESGHPAIVWTCPVPFSSLSFVGTGGMYTLLVIGLSDDHQVATVADRSPQPFEISCEDLNYCRARVCSLKNRSLTILPPKSISKAKLKSAVKAALVQSVQHILKPKMKTFGPPGLVSLTKVMANPKNQKGWPKVYPKGLIYLALRDMFDSIETAATGGGLYRNLFAEFLDESAEVLNKKGLQQSADDYRELAAMWTAYAEDLLPNRIKPFKQTKALLRKIDKAFIEKGPKANKTISKAFSDLNQIESGLQQKFVWSEAETLEFLTESAELLNPIIQKEIAAAENLSSCV